MKPKTKIEQKDAKTMVKKSKIARLKKKRNELWTEQRDGSDQMLF